jgi:hypothetical protein
MKFHSFILTIALLLSAPTASMAAKTDVVLLINGNTITGEIKSLEFGSLRYSTDSMGTVSIDWEDIVSITTKQTLQVEVSDGTRYFGRLDSAEDRFEIKVITLSDEVDLHTSRIVRMIPIDAEESFLERLDGSFALGFDSEKSSGAAGWVIRSRLRFREVERRNHAPHHCGHQLSDAAIPGGLAGNRQQHDAGRGRNPQPHQYQG